MTIIAASRGRLVPINNSVDRWALAALYVTAFLASPSNDTRPTSGALSLQIPFMIMDALLLVLLNWLFLTVYARWRLWRIKAQKLPADRASSLRAIIVAESARLGVRVPQVYWAPRNVGVSASILGGGMHRKLVVTAGLSVLAIRHAGPTAAMIRHELAHLKNKDVRAIPLIVVVIPLSIGYFLFALTQPVTVMLQAFLATTINVISALFLLRRVELLADAVAINATSENEDYCALLNTMRHASGGYHPTPAQRLRAATVDSPVLRTSIAMLFILAVTGLVSAHNINDIYSAYQSVEDDDVLAPFDTERESNEYVLQLRRLVALLLPVLGIVVELSKGLRRKYPASLALQATLSVASGATRGFADSFGSLTGVFGTPFNLAQFSVFAIAAEVATLAGLAVNHGLPVFSDVRDFWSASSWVTFFCLGCFLSRRNRDLPAVALIVGFTALLGDLCVLRPLTYPFGRLPPLTPSFGSESVSHALTFSFAFSASLVAALAVFVRYIGVTWLAAPLAWWAASNLCIITAWFLWSAPFDWEASTWSLVPSIVFSATLSLGCWLKDIVGIRSRQRVN